jgi:HSP20 family protein
MNTKELDSVKKEVQQVESTRPTRYFSPLTDIVEHEDHLLLIMDLPGIRKDEIDIHVENNLLKVETSFSEQAYQDFKPVYTEYNIGPYTRSFRLSNKVDQEGIEAKLEHGVLQLKLKKVQEKSVQITIQ